MGIEITIHVETCASCPFSVSNIEAHNDPFTYSPDLSYWTCRVEKGPRYIYKDNARKEIHPQCPKKAEGHQ
jgi:hypothetical protein